MSNHFRVDEFTEEEWQKFETTFSCNNIYQSWAYGEAHCSGSLKTISRAVLFDGDRPLVMAQFHVSRIPGIGLGVARTHWGPLWCHEEDPSSAEDHLGEFLSEVTGEYGVKRGLNIRFDPRSTFSKEQDDRLVQIFKQYGFSIDPHVRPYRTIILDLSQDLDLLRANLHSKWRNSLRKSEKVGFEVVSGYSIELFEYFLRIYDEMWANKTFKTGVDMLVIRRLQNMAAPGQGLLTFIVRHQGENVGAGVFAGFGNTIQYFLGATSPNLRQNINPGYFILWSSLCNAKSLGFRWYDLGGLTDLPNSGVDRFKKRMNGKYIMFPGRFETQPSTIRALIFDMGEKCFKKMRQLHK